MGEEALLDGYLGAPDVTPEQQWRLSSVRSRNASSSWCRQARGCTRCKSPRPSHALKQTGQGYRGDPWSGPRNAAQGTHAHCQARLWTRARSNRKRQRRRRSAGWGPARPQPGGRGQVVAGCFCMVTRDRASAGRSYEAPVVPSRSRVGRESALAGGRGRTGTDPDETAGAGLSLLSAVRAREPPSPGAARRREPSQQPSCRTRACYTFAA
jgi:hypothetical protein